MSAHAPAFHLDPRLEADTLPVAQGPLSCVRMMDDARFPWLILVPRRAALSELQDLTAEERALLQAEVDAASAALRAVAPGDKLNTGALGNIVRQLHVHVVMRRVGDPAWPGPVWGSGMRIPHEPSAARTVADALSGAFAGALSR
jgi:diadenosine tetraphosphate (Ap4A) HIT family hydrolase